MAHTPSWTNAPLEFYHGTDSDALAAYVLKQGHPVSGFTVDLGKCRPNTDFGVGFYVTTSLTQARNWANTRANRKAGRSTAKAVVLAFQVDRDWLASLDTLCFVTPSESFWHLIYASRDGVTPHSRSGLMPAYDVVYGPLTLYPQYAIVADSDQISFHTQRSVSGMPTPTVFDVAPTRLFDMRRH